MDSPAVMLRAALIKRGLVIMPAEPGVLVPSQQIPGDGTTLCYVASLGDEVDQAVCLMNTVGFIFGRRQRDPKTLIHHGVKLLVRALDEVTGYTLANTIIAGLLSVLKESVVVNGVTHYIQSVYQTSTLTPLGERVGTRQQQWVADFRVAMQDIEPSLG